METNKNLSFVYSSSNTLIKNKTKLLVYFVSIVYLSDRCQSDEHKKNLAKIKNKMVSIFEVCI